MATANPESETIHLSLPLPRSLDTRIYLHLNIKAKAVMLFLTTASAEDLSSPAPMGSFVYALPDRSNPSQPISTPLYTVEPTVDFATRMARMVARRTGLPAYVGSSLSLASTGMGGSAEEEMAAFRAVVEAVVSRLGGSGGGGVGGGGKGTGAATEP